MTVNACELSCQGAIGMCLRRMVLGPVGEDT